MNPPNWADLLLNVLPRSGCEPLTYAQLAHKLMGTPVDPPADAQTAQKRRSAIRECQEAVAALRDRGEPVCGGDDGMWLATTSAEAFTEYRRLRSRALGQIQRASKMKERAFKMRAAEVQQLPMFDAA